MQTRLTSLTLALLLALAPLATAAASSPGDYGFKEVPFFMIQEALPIHDIHPTLFIAIDTLGKGQDYIMNLFDDFATLMFYGGDVIQLEEFWYYTTMQSGFGEGSWSGNMLGTQDLIAQKYPDTSTRPKWRKILLYVDDRLIEGALMGEPWGGILGVLVAHDNNVEFRGINSTQGGFHGSVHGCESTARIMHGHEVALAHQQKYGNAHVMSQLELDEWAKAFGLPKISSDDPEQAQWRYSEDGVSGWSPAVLNQYTNSHYANFSEEQMRWYWAGGPPAEHEIWVKQKFISLLGTADYEAQWSFAQYPLPQNEAERAKVIAKLRMNEMSYADCDMLYGDGATAPVFVPPGPIDTAEIWAREGITAAIAKGFVPADLQDTYKAVITRAEFCRLAVKWVEYALGKNIDAILTERGLTGDPNAFSDTTDTDILAAYALKITSGEVAPAPDKPGRFNPTGKFTRQQAAVMIMNACRAIGADVNDPPTSDFSDMHLADSWAQDGINFCRANGIMNGKTVNPPAFDPKGVFTRQESIVTFNNIKPDFAP